MNSNAQKIANLQNDAETSILQVDARNPVHLALLRQGYKNLLGLEASIHGAGMTGDVPDEVIKAINAALLKVKFFMAGKEIAGIATSFRTVVARRNPKTKRVERFWGEYLEDYTVDPFQNDMFRKLTKSFNYPKGIGLGTAFTWARIWQSVTGAFGFSSSGEIVQAQVKEIAQDNEPMAGLMNKHGGIIGTADSRILELTAGPTEDMERRFGANVEMFHLPQDRSGKTSCPNNFEVSWFDGEREIVAIFTRTISTFTGPPVVRLQLTSNSILPDDEMLKEVLAAILVTGRRVIRDRGWGLPIGTPIPAFGGPVPVIRIHALEEAEIVQAFVQMDAEDRLCGSKLMVAARLDNDNVPNQVTVFGQELTKAEPINGISPSQGAYEPCFDLVSETKKDSSQAYFPKRPVAGRGVADNENVKSFEA